MSMAVGGKKGGAIAAINVTPMADIMIVLLIIFMVITPMLQKGVDVKLPVAGNTKDRKDEPKTIMVAVKKDTTTYLSGVKLSSQADLLPQIKERLQDLPEGQRIVFLKADEGPPYAEVMKARDLCREAGVEERAPIPRGTGHGGKAVPARDVARGAGEERVGIAREKRREEAGGVAPGGAPGAESRNRRSSAKGPRASRGPFCLGGERPPD